MKTDRRSRRTRQLLQKALIELIGERGYDAVTIQEIVDRANVGRTTFYQYYDSKDDLFMDCHETIVGELHLGLFHPLSREELISSQLPAEMSSAYRHLEEGRALLYSIFQGKDSVLILRQIRDRSAREIEMNLRSAFTEAESTVPLDMLANYLAGAQIALMQWWLEKRRPYEPNMLALMFRRMQRAAIREAFGVKDDK